MYFQWLSAAHWIINCEATEKEKSCATKICIKLKGIKYIEINHRLSVHITNFPKYILFVYLDVFVKQIRQKKMPQMIMLIGHFSQIKVVLAKIKRSRSRLSPQWSPALPVVLLCSRQSSSDFPVEGIRETSFPDHDDEDDTNDSSSTSADLQNSASCQWLSLQSSWGDTATHGFHLCVVYFQ